MATNRYYKVAEIRHVKGDVKGSRDRNIKVEMNRTMLIIPINRM